MILRRVFPEAGDPIDTAGDDCRERLAALYSPPRENWVRLNLIASVDGSARGVDGTSETLSSKADRAVLGAIRSVSDVVLIGAATLRAEGYLLPRRARLAVLTASGDLSGARVQQETDPDRVLVMGPAAAEATARASFPHPFTFIPLPVAADGGAVPGSAIRALNDLDDLRIVCEGGPRLAGHLIDHGLVDELCLSTSPRLVGGTLPVLGSATRSERRLELRQLLVDAAGGLYARWFPS